MRALTSDLTIGTVYWNIQSMAKTYNLNTTFTILNIYRSFNICTTIVFKPI